MLFFSPPVQHRCDGCLDILLRAVYDVFNPNLEFGPNRLTKRHRYNDGFMPDYPVPSTRAYRDRRTSRDGTHDTNTRPSMNYDEPSPADYVDDDGCDGCGGPVEGRDVVGGIRRSSPTTAGNSGYVPGDQPLTDFIVSLLDTAQLTSRATLKKSKGTSGRPFAPTARTTTTVRQKRSPVSPSPSESIVPRPL